jgi:hypothetical protein
MAAKRSRVETALKKAQSVLSNYMPGRRTAEATVDEVLRILGRARGALTGRKGRRGRRRKVGVGRAAAKRGSRKRSSGRKAAGRRRSARRVS